nr:chemotaxis protein CheB [Geobacter sp. DSM 9736]
MATRKETKKNKDSKETRTNRGSAEGAVAKKAPAKKLTAAEPQPVKPFYIVGFGASAGGIEALSELFEAIPHDTGMAFIVVQHLDPTHANMLPEIVGRKAAIPVKEAMDGVEVKANCVYIIPPNSQMTIKQGHLKLAPRDQTAGKFLPIDFFSIPWQMNEKTWRSASFFPEPPTTAPRA